MKLAFAVALAACQPQPVHSPHADVVAALARAFEDLYVFPDVGASAARELRAHAYAGDREELAAALTAQLRATTRDAHVRVLDHLPPPQREHPDRMLGEVRATDGVMYIELRTLGVPPDRARVELAAALASSGDVKAVVLDLRGNGGGHPETVAVVASFFVSDRAPLSETRDRSGAVQASFTDPRVEPKLSVPLYILTSARTFSGAEQLAYDLQALHRAVVVGERTAGGANPGGYVPLPDGFAAFVPRAQTINPITHANWDGVGISPDVAVDATVALDEAMRRAR